MLGLYIHIPFCVTKCKYCDFNSFKIDLNEKIKYLNYLGEEMKLYKEEIKNREIDSVFVGGGTPSILNENEINIFRKAHAVGVSFFIAQRRFLIYER